MTLSVAQRMRRSILAHVFFHAPQGRVDGLLRAPYAHEGSTGGRWGPFTWGWTSGLDGKKTFNLVRFSVFSVMQPRLVPIEQSPAMRHEWIESSPLSMGGCRTVMENPPELIRASRMAAEIGRAHV